MSPANSLVVTIWIGFAAKLLFSSIDEGIWRVPKYATMFTTLFLKRNATFREYPFLQPMGQGQWPRVIFYFDHTPVHLTQGLQNKIFSKSCETFEEECTLHLRSTGYSCTPVCLSVGNSLLLYYYYFVLGLWIWAGNLNFFSSQRAHTW